MDIDRKLRGELPCLLGRPLTEIELEILKLVSQGHSYPEIASMRKRRPNTVKNQGRTLQLKLGARNNAHAVAIAKDKGLLGMAQEEIKGLFETIEAMYPELRQVYWESKNWQSLKSEYSGRKIEKDE